MAGRSERDSLGKFTRKHNKYGSTSQSNDTNETFLKHHVITGETLQGIALKYGLSMEEIKRANNIWTNDSLFLRDYLLIPLSKSPMKASVPFANGSTLSTENSSFSDCEIITKQELKAAKMSRTSSMKSQESISDNSHTDVSARDFLSKFDSSLAQIRTSVKSLQETSSIPQDDSNPLSFLSPKKTSRYNSRIRSRSSESDDSLGEPSLVFKSKGASRKIRSSLERLEGAQDELFQL